MPYSADHHSKDIQAIKKVLDSYNSLLVLGLSGFGKSSVLRFLVSNPEVQSREIVYVYIDCNLLDWSLSREAIQDEIFSLMNLQLRGQSANTWGIGRASRQLRDFMKEFASNVIDNPDHLVIIFDRSESLQSVLGVPFFNQLRALRDLNPSLSYIFSGRYLYPDEFGELTDILWHEPHWIGSLSLEDAEMAVNRHLTRLAINLESEEVAKVVRCGGFHPQILKYTCELIKAGVINLGADEEEIIKQLVRAPSIKHQCQDLWNDLSGSDRNALQDLANFEKLPSKASLENLMRCGILKRAGNSNIEFMSPVFKTFVTGLGPSPLTLENGVVFKGSEAVNLSKEEFSLFQVLWSNQPNIVSLDRISQAVWSDAQGAVTPQMITNLVKRLRDKLGGVDYIKNVRGRGYFLTE